MGRACRDMRAEESSAVVSAVEHLANQNLGPAGSSRAATRHAWARTCLTVMAQAQDSGICRQAVLALGCAVHDDDPEIRSWARSSLKRQAQEIGEITSSPVYAFVQMAQGHNPGGAEVQLNANIDWLGPL